jgi:hypothetical protein
MPSSYDVSHCLNEYKDAHFHTSQLVWLLPVDLLCGTSSWPFQQASPHQDDVLV